jgi:hypothetical protein
MHAVADSDLSANAKQVALTLALNMDNDTLEAWPAIDVLVRRSSRCRDTVLRGRDELRTAGWLEWTPGGGRGHSTHYRGRFPDEETVGSPDGFSEGASNGNSPTGRKKQSDTSEETVRWVDQELPKNYAVELANDDIPF